VEVVTTVVFDCEGTALTVRLLKKSPNGTS